jgi:Domain of unknown function (DUF4290)
MNTKPEKKPAVHHGMEYNAGREHLILKEYGRNVQKLIAHINSLTDKAERTRLSHTLIYLMKQLNPSVREHNDNPQRIWDHLQVMADFSLDIDGPYPIPERSILHQKPQKMEYPGNKILFKYYGKNLELLIARALQMEEGENKILAFGYIARVMREFQVAWNRESPENVVILDHLSQLTNGQIQLTESVFSESVQSSGQPQTARNSGGSGNGSGNSGNRPQSNNTSSKTENNGGKRHRNRDRDRDRDRDRKRKY